MTSPSSVAPCGPPTAGPKIVLFAPAGCGVGYLRPLVRALSARGATPLPLERPGHGRRWAEPPATSDAAVLAAVDTAVLATADVVYGESMGAYLGLLGCALLRQLSAPASQQRLVVCSNLAPSSRAPIAPPETGTALAVTAAFTAMGGQLPAELDPATVGERTVTRLGAEVELSRSLLERTRHASVDLPITAIRGREDANVSSGTAWRCHTTAALTCHTVPGPHLLSAHAPGAIAELILTGHRDRDRGWGAPAGSAETR